MNGNEDDQLSHPFDEFLRRKYPQKYRQVQSSWNRNIYTRIEGTCHLGPLYTPFLLVLQTLYGNIIHVEAFLMDMVLSRNIIVRDEVPTCVDNIDNQIVDSIKEFMQKNTSSQGGRTTNELRKDKDSVFTACLSNNNISKRKVRVRPGSTGYIISKINVATVGGGNYKNPQPKKHATTTSGLQSHFVYNSYHSEESSTIVYNSRKIIEVKGEKM